VPKTVDHEARRRELADAAIRAIAREGLAATTLAMIAAESGWSIGSIRHYFQTKNDLIESALWRVGERIDERIRRRTAGGMTLADLRTAAVELLPLDATGREESLVWLAFAAQAAIEPDLSAAAEDAARRLQKPLVDRFREAARTGELRPDVDPEHEAARLRVLRDGLDLQLLTTPKRTSKKRALQMLDEHLEALRPVQRRR
jgi:AcrR family transcriptional regulator